MVVSAVFTLMFVEVIYPTRGYSFSLTRNCFH